METCQLADGRVLSYDTYGASDGHPVIFNHGFSDSRLIRNPDESIAISLGLRMIAADQPGVGGSSPDKRRRMVDWGADMEELADSLGVADFAVLGHSGGGPHAMSIAHRMPDRVTKLALASPVAPLSQPGMAKLLVNKDLKLIARLHHLHGLIKVASNMSAKKALKDIPSFVEATAQADPSDAHTFLDDPDQKEMFEASFTAGMEQGGEGMYEMTMALWDWGFSPSDISTPTDLFYGDADDILSPRMPLAVAEQLQDCTTHVWPGAGHYGFVDRERWTQFLSSVAVPT
ncbi:MAG: alpha/beta hydrolase [Actinobacteria bacterium]|nr:alpha/beta hydrolase [Actinomycetota bacterium]